MGDILSEVDSWSSYSVTIFNYALFNVKYLIVTESSIIINHYGTYNTFQSMPIYSSCGENVIAFEADDIL